MSPVEITRARQLHAQLLESAARAGPGVSAHAQRTQAVLDWAQRAHAVLQEFAALFPQDIGGHMGLAGRVAELLAE